MGVPRGHDVHECDDGLRSLPLHDGVQRLGGGHDLGCESRSDRLDRGETEVRHIPRAPLNTEFNFVLKYGLKMRLSPKFTGTYLILGVLREL